MWTDIREAGRNTQGVKLIRLNNSDEIASVTRILKEEEDEETGEETTAIVDQSLLNGQVSESENTDTDSDEDAMDSEVTE